MVNKATALIFLLLIGPLMMMAALKCNYFIGLLASTGFCLIVLMFLWLWSKVRR